ncbi:hypothetical protein MFLAVUS_006103 [Mucor flavus]|uniref:C3H1-type domain-containing protein n=1 Tax=Mucor flavus TaxID=439312 RepID=A0ABP9Z0N3_9FUNG
MAICKFFQAGNCRNGNRCNFDHIKPNAAATSKYNESSIKLNLTEERPQWKLSVYGPAKEEPNLIVVNMQLVSHEQSFNQMETQVNAILSNPTGAIQHYEKQKSNHSGPFGGPASNAPFAPFTAPTNLFGGGGGGYGQQSAFGASKPATTFGQPSAFGTASAAAPVSAFGQPSAFGSTSTLGGGGAFGSTSALGSGGGSAFGSTNALGGGSAFGSTSALGGGGAFGSTSALGGSGSAFGSTSALGGGGSAFGSTSALGGGGGGSAFGSTSALGSGSAFGSTSALGSGTSAFGQPSAFGAMANQPATTTPTSAFGAAPSAFGATPSAFGATTTPSAFGAATNTPSAFGAAATPSAFGNTSTLGAFGNAGNTAFGTTNNVPGTMQTGSDVDTESPEWKAFAASEFTYRAIPEIEPPIQLR